ncbi:MAG: glycosyltransferase family A protein [Cyanobium sp.]
MSREAVERGDWQAVIDGHALESHEPADWLHYGVALLQTLTPGAEAGRQQQQAALAFEQAKKEGASPEAVAAAQRHSVLISLNQALIATGMTGLGGLKWPFESEKIANQPEQPAEPAQRTGPAVTLTAISIRMDTLPAVIDSLRAQSLKPVRLHLHLSHEPHLLDEGIAADHPVVQQLRSDPWVQVHWVPNLGPYRKIVPFLNAGGYGDERDDDLFVTVDDDTLYPPRFIEYLLRQRERHGCIVAHRGRRMRLAAQEGFLPYSQWHDGYRESRFSNLPTGQSGVLYRRSDFPADLELEAALALAPTHDDLWLRWLIAWKGVSSVILQPNAAAKTHELAFPSASAKPAKEQPSLWFAYNAPEAAGGTDGANDAAIRAVSAYFRTRGFDLEAVIRKEQEESADFY